MDVEELRVTYYDWMRMTGRLLMTIRSAPFSQGQNIPICEDLDGGSNARVEKSCYPRVRRVHS